MEIALGQRKTRQREIILRLLHEAKGPLSIQELFAQATKETAVGIATVYRTVSLLLEAEQIQTVILPSGETRYESANLGHHDHFQCRKCAQVFDLEVCPLHLASGTIIPGGFMVESHAMTLYGLCAECAAQAATPKATAKKKPAKK
jgi:Fur family ferric uptake transcriptional regulator